MENKDKYLLCFFSLFCFFCSAHGLCRQYFKENNYFTNADYSKPTLDVIFQKFFTNSVLDDKCYSKDNPEFEGKFRSSLSISTGTSERETISTFFRTYYQSSGKTSQSSGGFFEFNDTKPYIAWYGGTHDGAQTGLRTGRIYILDVHSQNQDWTTDDNSALGGTTITYYSCFNNYLVKGETINIVQAKGGTKLDRQNNLEEAKKRVKELTSLTPDLHYFNCYYHNLRDYVNFDEDW